MGEMLGVVKGMLVNLVVRHVKKMVPAWHIPGALDLQHALAAGRRHGFQAPELGLDDLAFLQYTGGTTGVSKGAMLTPPQHRRQRHPGPRLDQPAGARARRTDRHRAAALSHLRADRELPDLPAHRRHQPADRQSARHSGLHQGTEASTRSRSSPASTPCSTRCSTIRISPALDFSTAAHHARRRHGGAEAGGRPLAAGHRQRR